ncbi:MAG: TauD/TfdA family dioxygenase [Devosia sp.]
MAQPLVRQSETPTPPAPLAFRPVTGRDWVRADLDRRVSELVRAVPAALNLEIEAMLRRVRRQGLTLETVEAEDTLLPSFARMVPQIRAELEEGSGVTVLTGIAVDTLNDEDGGILAYAIGNHIGRILRQGINKDRRIFTVTNTGDTSDPIRIGVTAKKSAMHSDNACLERRAADYLGLFCVENAAAGGESTLLSAQTLYRIAVEERPDLLPLFHRPWHFQPPALHTWPEGPQTIQKPIFDTEDGILHVHYARVMIENGAKKRGVSLTAEEREALDWFDGVLERPEIVWTHALGPGEILLTHNLATLHGRLAFTDDGTKRRVLKRIWMRARGAGDDPALMALNTDRYGSQAT